MPESAESVATTETRESMPAAKGTMPATKGTMPATKGTMPATKGTVPATEEPATERTTPPTDGDPIGTFTFDQHHAHIRRRHRDTEHDAHHR